MYATEEVFDVELLTVTGKNKQARQLLTPGNNMFDREEKLAHGIPHGL